MNKKISLDNKKVDIILLKVDPEFLRGCDPSFFKFYKNHVGTVISAAVISTEPFLVNVFGTDGEPFYLINDIKNSVYKLVESPEDYKGVPGCVEETEDIGVIGVNFEKYMEALKHEVTGRMNSDSAGISYVKTSIKKYFDHIKAENLIDSGVSDSISNFISNNLNFN